jgi:dihydrofolate synthase/folylpolyglutamate synthase
MDREPRALVGRPYPTFFEITTAMAMLHFARQRVDAAVLEVGLGGRLDSTNVCRPAVCGITSISFDHMKQLGNTLGAIAREKAGIIKPGVPVVSGVVADEPRQVISAVAAACGAPLVQRGRDFDLETTADNERFAYVERSAEGTHRLDDLTVGMLGQHHRENAAVAAALARQMARLGWKISDGQVREGLASARCAARIEVLGSAPPTIVDVAHNLASVEALVRVLNERFPGRRRVLVFASSRDKDTAGMLGVLLPHFERTILTRYVNNPRAMPPEELWLLAQQAAPMRAATIETAADPKIAWTAARRHAAASDLICITGSFFLAAEMRGMAADL